mgnify:CR=1 FL=1
MQRTVRRRKPRPHHLVNIYKIVCYINSYKYYWRIGIVITVKKKKNTVELGRPILDIRCFKNNSELFVTLLALVSSTNIVRFFVCIFCL